MQSGRNWNEYPAAKWRRVIKHVLISHTHSAREREREGREEEEPGEQESQRPTVNVDNAATAASCQLAAGRQEAGQEQQQPPNVAHNVLQTLVNSAGGQGEGKGGGRGVVGAVKIQ